MGRGKVAKLHHLSGIIRKQRECDVAFLRQREVFLQPLSVFTQRKRIVPDKGFYLIDIISEKTPFDETELAGGGKYDAKMRHRRNLSCEKSILEIAFTSWNYRKRHPIRVETSTFSRNACPPKDRKQGFDKYKTFKNRKIDLREKGKALFQKDSSALSRHLIIRKGEGNQSLPP